MSDISIWLCGHGETRDGTVTCLLEAIRRIPYKIEVNYISGDALIGRSRSRASTQFLKDNQAPYMIFLDTDITFSPEELEKLIKALQAGYDVVAGAYGVANGSRLAIRGVEDQLKIDGGIHEVEYVSTGFMGISRKCLEKIRDDLKLPLLHKGEWCECYPFFESGRYEPEMFYISEDWDFCNKARQAGYKVYFHTGCLVDHMKLAPVICEDVLAKNKVVDPSTEYADWDIVRDLAEYLNEPFVKVRDEVINSKFKSCEKTSDSNLWLYDLAQFNSRKDYKEERLYALSALNNHKILDFGCGIGTASFFVSDKNTVTGYDINPEVIKFAQYRQKRNGWNNVTFTTELPDLKEFDMVLFIDVLEHFEDLRSFLVDFCSKLKRGTRVYHRSPFEQKLPGHYDHSKEWATIIEEAGLIPIEDRWSIKS